MQESSYEFHDLVQACRDEDDMNAKIFLFDLIRKSVEPVKMPSLLTDDYINSFLDRISTESQMPSGTS
jgi:hypothetical protein